MGLIKIVSASCISHRLLVKRTPFMFAREWKTTRCEAKKMCAVGGIRVVAWVCLEKAFYGKHFLWRKQRHIPAYTPLLCVLHT